MRRLISLMAALVAAVTWTGAQTADPVDVLDYDISLDLSQGNPFHGVTTLTVTLAEPQEYLRLDLRYTVDSVLIDGEMTEETSVAAIPVSGQAAGEPFEVTVYYHGNGYVEGYGWGGFHFDADMYYNLGVAFNENPHVVGRMMFPCRDNFYDKATYTLRVKTRTGWTAQCGGTRQSVTTDAEGCELSVWRIPQPTPTYLVSVSTAAWNRIETVVSSVYGNYPVTLAYTTEDSAGVRQAFAELDSVVPMFERCFGPYRWDCIGYIATEQGSMEHVNNIALDRRFMASTSSRAQSTIAHELAHAWFGNLVTCASEGDMWINEGGATFCSEVAVEAVSGRAASNHYYQQSLDQVLRTTHITDHAYRALHGMPHSLTYGSTTYDKGALVWHSLRGYLGDSVFYSCMRRLMERCAFGNLDAAGVRDSLSAYSGVDLTDFFAFHVESPGFVNYHLEKVHNLCCAEEWVLHVRQQGVGTDSVAQGNRIPVTFFSAFGDETYKHWITFDGVEADVTIPLTFTPAYYVLDYDCEISDAATVAEARFETTGTKPLSIAHCNVSASTLAEPATVVVEHHWGKPIGLAGTTGVTRAANRYWVVTGRLNTDVNSLKGQFKLVRGNNSTSSAAYLDRGFYENESSYDSIRLWFRPAGSLEWTCVKRSRNGNNSEASYNATLMPGEYAFAMIDTVLVGIDDTPAQPGGDKQMNLFPNPLPQGMPLTIGEPIEGEFEVSVYDESGRRIRQRKGCRSGEPLNLDLTAGSYLVQIKNNCVSLQSNLIQL